MLYRKTEDIAINLFYFSTFYGGADPSWAPTSDQYIYFDNFRISTTPLPGSETTLSVAEVESGAPSAVVENSLDTDGSDSAQPAIAAAQAGESGGGGFFGLAIGLLILVRRRV